jgi:peptidoglycan/LPS O-acetylase OafA/YrhL
VGAPAARPDEPDARRADIEGLRAVAVLAVLVFHAGVPHLSGGFVGVDVFFVISGFLITQQLLRPLRAGGPLSLKDFYARRARRILPAAAVVLLAVLAVARLTMPPLRQVDLVHDVMASALYVPNWWFIAGQVDYSRAGLAVSPLLHYWSLGVEEQFYLLWPGLLLAAAAIARRRGLSLPAVVVALLGVVITASFMHSLLLTRTHQPLAFLGSPARAWQFGVGALLAVWLPSGKAAPAALRLGPGMSGTAAHGPGRTRIPLPPGWIGWIGLAAITWAIVAFDELTPYPGAAVLLPTLGAAAVIAAGARVASVGVAGDGPASHGETHGGVAHPGVANAAVARSGHPAARARAPHTGGVTGRWLSPARWLSSAPMRLIGRLSFTWYLWHWPALVLTEAVTGPLAWPARVAVVVGSAIPAWLTMKLVEDRIRFAGPLLRRPGLGLAVAAAATCLPLLAASALGVEAGTLAGATPSSTVASVPATVGDPFDAVQQAAGGSVTPAPAKARADLPTYPKSCQLDAPTLVSPPCQIGPAPRGHVVLLGDSHAVEWFSGVQRVAGARGLSVEILAKGGCPLPVFMTVPAELGRPYTECATWRENVLDRLAAEPRPAVIFVSTMNHYLSDQTVVMAGWRTTLARLARLGAPIVYLRDNPYPGTDVPACISGAATNWARCAFPRASGLPQDPLAAAITAGTVPGARMVDLTALLCPPGPATCPAALGHTLLYKDISHLTNTAVLRLTPALEADLVRQHVVAARR